MSHYVNHTTTSPVVQCCTVHYSPFTSLRGVDDEVLIEDPCEVVPDPEPESGAPDLHAVAIWVTNQRGEVGQVLSNASSGMQSFFGGG